MMLEICRIFLVVATAATLALLSAGLERRHCLVGFFYFSLLPVQPGESVKRLGIAPIEYRRPLQFLDSSGNVTSFCEQNS